MKLLPILLGLPSGLVVVFAIAALVTAGLVFYALYSKGDVRAEFSHGSTRFRLEAKDRMAAKKGRS